MVFFWLSKVNLIYWMANGNEEFVEYAEIIAVNDVISAHYPFMERITLKIE